MSETEKTETPFNPKHDITKAAEQVKLVARSFQAVIDVAVVLGHIGSIENAATEAEGRLDALRREEAELGNANAIARDELNKASSSLANIQLDIDAKIASAKAMADEQAAKIIATAHAQVDLIIAQAETDRDKVLAETQANQKVLEQTLLDLATGKKELADTHKAHDEVKTHLRKIAN